jgi:anti-anti-sigma factor
MRIEAPRSLDSPFGTFYDNRSTELPRRRLFTTAGMVRLFVDEANLDRRALMTDKDAMIWESAPFSIERWTGKSPSTVIIRLCGHFTARDMYGRLTPDELQKMFDMEHGAGETPIALNILDLTEVPYMDSMGLGMIVTHHVRCHNRGIRMVAAGVSPRVLQLLMLTKVDGVIPMAVSVEAAEDD